MEKLLHYVWKHKMFPLKPLTTTDGMRVEVIDPGLQNTDAGPDFFNAKVKLDGTMWAGNVEIHDSSSDWYVHGHDHDAAYDSVVLHVVCRADREVFTSGGKRLPQLVLGIPESVFINYSRLVSEDAYPPCHKVIPTLPGLTVHSFLSRLTAERMERKLTEVEQRAALCSGSWEQALFMTMARSFGFGINSDAFEEWGRVVPLSAAGHHRDDRRMIEALFLGQAGLLDARNLPSSQRDAAATDDYFLTLCREYKFLRAKFGLTPMSAGRWRWLRLRPQNFPYIRLSQLAELYCSCRCGLSALLDCKDVDALHDILHTGTTPYWQTHLSFGRECKQRTLRLTTASVDSIIINAVVPVFAAYARHRCDEHLTRCAGALLEALPAERNSIVSSWNACGLKVNNAADSQALIQLKRCYCDRKDCLRCRFGYEMLRIKN